MPVESRLTAELQTA